MWKPDNSYVKSAYKDSDDKSFLYKKKKGAAGHGMAKPIPPIKALGGPIRPLA